VRRTSTMLSGKPPRRSADLPIPGQWSAIPPAGRNAAAPGGRMRPAYRPGPRRWPLFPAAALVPSGLTAGCSSSKPAYCTDASQLETSVQNLGNVDVAKNGLSSLQTAGLASVVFMASPVGRNAWNARQAAKHAASPVTRAATVSARALAVSIKRRCGTATRVADPPGAVLTGDSQHAELADGDLGQVQAAEAEPGGIDAGLLAGAEVAGQDDAEQRRRHDVESHRCQQRPEGRADCAELAEPRPDDVGEQRQQAAGGASGWCRSVHDRPSRPGPGRLAAACPVVG
jgi:hypothetical protein